MTTWVTTTTLTESVADAEAEAAELEKEAVELETEAAELEAGVALAEALSETLKGVLAEYAAASMAASRLPVPLNTLLLSVAVPL